MERRKKQHPKIYRDELGEYRWQTYFFGGKQKRVKIRLIDSMDADEFIENNADDIWLHQNGNYEIHNQIEMERKKVEEDSEAVPKSEVAFGPTPIHANKKNRVF